MTTPTPADTPLDPTPEFDVQPSPVDFGPNPANSADGPTPTGERVSTRAARKDNGKGSLFGTLGQNKKPRSGIRKLTDADRDKIASLYTAMAIPVMPFKPKVAQALALSADKCADAWIEVGNENDRVRRMILAAIEGGTWGKLFAAHALIIVAILPENAMPFGNVDMAQLVEMFGEDGIPNES